MKKSLVTAFVAVLVTIHGAAPDESSGVTVRRMGFEEMVRGSSLIVQGRVLALEAFWGGGADVAGGNEGAKTSRPPEVGPGSGQQPVTAPSPPVEVGTRGGRMIFTRVTMEATSTIQGSSGSVFEFVVAGGALDGRAAVIPGMPKFEVGETYLLFLRPGYQRVGDPVVGVNQGFFRVVEDPRSGLQVLLSAESDYVLGVEEDRIVTRHNPQRPGSGPQPAGPPAADRPETRAQMSAEVQRYWYSTEPLMTVGDFVNAIRTRIRR